MQYYLAVKKEQTSDTGWISNTLCLGREASFKELILYDFMYWLYKKEKTVVEK